MNERKYYTGVGSRKTPPDIIKLMKTYAVQLDGIGYTLRSGGAKGADSAFYNGLYEHTRLNRAVFKPKLYLPWKGYNGFSGVGHDSVCPQANELAQQVFDQSFGEGSWSRLKHGTKRLLARNSYQVLGKDLKTPSDFVVCWTPDGIEHWEQRTRNSGGTGQTVAVASLHDIPVFNLKNPSSIGKLESLIKLMQL